MNNPAPSLPPERFIAFECGDDVCLGVIAMPLSRPATIGVLVVVGGPQYRVGSHRQFVRLSRELARSGYAVLRFDYRGMGDSTGPMRTFEAIERDLDAAITAMRKETGVARVVLWGLCDGASAALMYGANDSRVAAIVAVNPWARSTQGEAVTRLRHYYARRLFSATFWRRLLRGDVEVRRGRVELAAAMRAARESGRSNLSGTYLARMQDGWSRFGRPVLVGLSGRDLTAREFEAWVHADRRRRGLLRADRCEVRRFTDADHTFSRRIHSDAVSQATIEWMRDLESRPS